MRERILLLTLSATGIALALAPRPLSLVWNFTESVPVGLYRVEQTPPRRGDIVVLAATGQARETLDAYRVLPPGRLLLKQLAAVAGDIVCRDTTLITINGAAVATAREHTGAGRPLPVWSGCRVLRTGEIFVLAPHPASFDGRYLGPMGADEMAGVAHPIFTLPPSQESL